MLYVFLERNGTFGLGSVFSIMMCLSENLISCLYIQQGTFWIPEVAIIAGFIANMIYKMWNSLLYKPCALRIRRS